MTEDIKSSTIKVRNALDFVVESYELKNYGKNQEVLQLTLLPGYKGWMV